MDVWNSGALADIKTVELDVFYDIEGEECANRGRVDLGGP